MGLRWGTNRTSKLYTFMIDFILKHFTGTLLFFTAKILMTVLYTVGFPYSFITHWVRFGWHATDRYMFKCALIDDIHGNTYLAKLFNDTLIKSKPGVIAYKFGNPRETISSVLGKNKQLETLTWLGVLLDKILHLFDSNHSIKSIEEITIEFPNKINT
jgi:8-oxo-dGTP diphosphatase